jgi:hypothetical protein
MNEFLVKAPDCLQMQAMRHTLISIQLTHRDCLRRLLPKLPCQKGGESLTMREKKEDRLAKWVANLPH